MKSIRNRLSILVLIAGFIPQIVLAGISDNINEFGYDPSSFVKPDQLDLTVNPKITLDLVDGNFLYAYNIESLPSSRQRLVLFELEIGEEVEGLAGIGINEKSIISDKLGWQRGSVTRTQSGMVNIPENLVGAIHWAVSRIELHGEAASDTEIHYRPPQYSIKPGDKIMLTFKAKGIPKIQRFWARGWVRPINEEELVAYARHVTGDTNIEIVDEIPDSVFKSLPRRVGYSDAFQGKTIGPRSVPSDPKYLCDTFIVELTDQVRDAVTLGWIKHDLRKDEDNPGNGKGDEKGVKKGQDKDDDEAADGDDSELREPDRKLPGVAKSIIKKLQKVRRECLRGWVGNAREKLRALLRQVNAQRGKHLTEEVYALIKFNAEFLLEKL